MDGASEVLHFLAEEESLLQLQFDSSFPEESNDGVNVIQVGLRVLGEDEDVS